MKQNLKWKRILIYILVLTLFLGKGIAGFGIIIGSIFLIIELINKKFESIEFFFILMYVYVGLKSIPGFSFQYIEAVNQVGENRLVPILILPEFFPEFNLSFFSLSIPLILSVFFFSYFLFMLFSRPDLFYGLNRFYIILFALICIPAIIGFVKATLNGVNGSLAATKSLFELSVVFFGFIYARLRSRDTFKLLFLLKHKFIYVLAFLLIVGLMYNHIVFIYLGVASSIAVYVLLIEKRYLKFSFLILSIFLGTVNTTFTIVLIPVVCGLLTALSIRLFSFNIRKWLPRIGFIIYIGFMILVLSEPKQSIKLQDETSTEGRLYNKIYGDRYFVWTSYIEQIILANPFLVIPQEDIKLNTVNDTEREVSFGAHNSLIQLIYYFGIIYGSILFLILYYILSRMIFYSKYLPKFVQSIAMGLFGVFLVFGLTGHSIVSHAACLFFWLFVGLVTGLGVQVRQENLTLSKKKLYKDDKSIKKIN